jgi:hypothetical protein
MAMLLDTLKIFSRTAAVAVAVLTLAMAGASVSSPARASTPTPKVALTERQAKAAKEFAGPRGDLYSRNVLVEHPNGKLELLGLLIGRRPGGSTALVDADGHVYTGGLDDFRAHNELLTDDDNMLVPRDITATVQPKSGEGLKLVTVSGHIPADRTPWLVGAAAAVVVLGAGLFLFRRKRRLRAAGSANIPADPEAPDPVTG